MYIAHIHIQEAVIYYRTELGCAEQNVQHEF